MLQVALLVGTLEMTFVESARFRKDDRVGRACKKINIGGKTPLSFEHNRVTVDNSISVVSGRVLRKRKEAG